MLLLYLAGCTVSDKPETEIPSSTEERLEKSSFDALNGWNNQQASGLKQTLTESCKIYVQRSGQIKDDSALFGSYEQWHPLCHKLNTLSKTELKTFFEESFDVYQVSPNETGLFTGYYIPHIKGSKNYSAKYSTPVLKQPYDLIKMKPKQFGIEPKEKKKKVIQGKIKNGWLVPYDDREMINGRIKKNNYEQDIVIWLEDKVERFFLQVQGSGIVELDNGETVHLAYGGRNGFEYFPIGKYLLQTKKVKNASMQNIKAWLRSNPDEIENILHKNKLFIFFKENADKIIRGAQNTPLIAEHSVAVDTQHIPLGTPLFIETTVSVDKKPFQRAVTAQDIGSAIKGAVRADIFFGTGEQAGRLAGGQHATGRMYAFIPK